MKPEQQVERACREARVKELLDEAFPGDSYVKTFAAVTIIRNGNDVVVHLEAAKRCKKDAPKAAESPRGWLQFLMGSFSIPVPWPKGKGSKRLSDLVAEKTTYTLQKMRVTGLYEQIDAPEA